MPFPQEEENKKKRIKGMEEEGGDEGVGASGSLRSLVIFITRKRLTLLFVSLPYESLPRSIFKLTGHSNKFSLFSRHYKYNLEREYFAVPHPINRSTSHPSSFFILSAMKENFGGKIRRFLSLSLDHIALDFTPISNGRGISIGGILVSFRFHFRPSFRKSAFSSCISYRLRPPINRCRDSRPQRESSITNLFSGR